MTQIINPKEPTLQVADILRDHIADYQKAYPLVRQASLALLLE